MRLEFISTFRSMHRFISPADEMKCFFLIFRKTIDRAVQCALYLSSQCLHLCQNFIVAQRSALDGLVRRPKDRLFNLLEFALADIDEITMSCLAGHQVRDGARYYGRRLEVLRYCVQECLEIGQHLCRRPGGCEGVDTDGETRRLHKARETAAEADHTSFSGGCNACESKDSKSGYIGCAGHLQ
jgi:hypothetical protein